MKATSRDVVLTALFISLAGTVAIFLAVVVQIQSASDKATFDILLGLGIMAWLYAGITALEVAGQSTLRQVGAAFVLVLFVVAAVTILG